MSDAQYAGLDAFQAAAGGKRRFTTLTLPVLGEVRLRSIDALEYAAIESALTRAGMAAQSNKAKQHKQLLMDAYCSLLILMVCDDKGNPILTECDEHRTMLKKLDHAISSTLVSAALRHSGLDEDNLDELAKKSERASS